MGGVMSSVTISGDTSGSIILQAPSVAGSTTLTLPTTTGTLAITGGAVSGTTGSFSGDLSFNSGYGSVATAYGCRAWAKFSNIGVIANSGNVSSVTKNGTGNYAVNFTTAMPDVNYSAVATADIGGWNTGATQTGDYQTTYIGIQSRNLSMTATDATVSVAVFR